MDVHESSLGRSFDLWPKPGRAHATTMEMACEFDSYVLPVLAWAITTTPVLPTTFISEFGTGAGTGISIHPPCCRVPSIGRTAP